MIKNVCLLTLIFLTYGCFTPHLIYTPAPQNIPYFEKKNETFMTGQGFVTPGEDLIGFNGSLSHSFTKNIGIISSASKLVYTYNYVDPLGSDEGYDKKGGNIRHYELALGYFTFKKGYFHVDSYGGLGYGITTNMDFERNVFLKTKYTQPYFLVSLGTLFKGSIPNVYFSNKFAQINYHKIENKITELGGNMYNYEILREKNSFTFLETAITIRIRITENAAFKAQLVMNNKFHKMVNPPNVNDFILIGGYEFLLPYGNKQ